MREALNIAIFWALVVLVHVGLAMPSAIRERSWKRLFVAAIVSFIGIVLPLFIFITSAMLVPEWKGGCRHGWFDCFHMGKLVMIPLVLWASAALYAIEVLRVQNRTRPWIVAGIVTGAVISTICLIVGIIIHAGNRQQIVTAFSLWLIVPLYVAIWYLGRTRQLVKAAGWSARAAWSTVLGSVPFWIAAGFLSRKYFASLPDAPPSCFVATAAIHGHPAVVGPVIRLRRNGEDRDATAQLATLWCFEDLWMKRAPRSHAGFRRFYNVAGPVIASRIANPFLADFAHLAIKPAEIMARAILKRANTHNPNWSRPDLRPVYREVTPAPTNIFLLLFPIYKALKMASTRAGLKARRCSLRG